MRHCIAVVGTLQEDFLRALSCLSVTHLTIAPYSSISCQWIGQWVYKEPRSTGTQSPSTVTVNNYLFVQANDPRGLFFFRVYEFIL